MTLRVNLKTFTYVIINILTLRVSSTRNLNDTECQNVYNNVGVKEFQIDT
jgi:hypothetical protein